MVFDWSYIVDEITVMDWYCIRELDMVPLHFTGTTAKPVDSAVMWIRSNLHGRWAMVGGVVYFEDPSEALQYELMWG